jgi:gamma-glutamyl:cysteine ligase YbdK (ATP-grasp superfamily)
MRAITFILALAASSAFLSGVVTSYAVSAQTRPPIAAERPITRDVPAVSRTPSEKAMDSLDTQLSKKLNVCRGC